MDQAQPKKKDNVRYITWILILASLFPLVFSGYPLLKQVALDTIGVQATGKVSALLGNKTKSPVVRFRTEQGQEIEFKSHYATNFISFDTGQDVEVLYLAVYPHIAEVSLLGRLHYLSNLGTSCLGVILLLAAFVSMMNKAIVLDFSKRNRSCDVDQL